MFKYQLEADAHTPPGVINVIPCRDGATLPSPHLSFNRGGAFGTNSSSEERTEICITLVMHWS